MIQSHFFGASTLHRTKENKENKVIPGGRGKRDIAGRGNGEGTKGGKIRHRERQERSSEG